MGTEKEHKSKYSKNKNFLKEFNNVDYCEWAITVDFYCGLHVVDAYLAKEHDLDFKSHTKRNRYISYDPILKSIYNDYDGLYNLSRMARYDGVILKPKKLQRAQMLLLTIENYMIPLINAI